MKIRLRIRPRGTADDRDVKKPKWDDDAVDRLSELPNSLILEILSRLPMGDIVRTSVLSKRWKDLWITLPCFNFKEIWEGKAEEFFSSPSFSSLQEQLRRSTYLRKVEVVVTWHLNDHSLYDLIRFLMKDGKGIEKIVANSIGNKPISAIAAAGTKEEFAALGRKVFGRYWSIPGTCLRSVTVGRAQIIFGSDESFT